MGFFSDLLTRKEIANEGGLLAGQLAKRLRKEEVDNEKRVSAEFQMLLADAVAYQRRANLGLVGKSHLVNHFQWALISSGYPEDFAKDMGGQLAIAMAATR